jgi:hypothetical protein
VESKGVEPCSQLVNKDWIGYGLGYDLENTTVGIIVKGGGR